MILIDYDIAEIICIRFIVFSIFGDLHILFGLHAGTFRFAMRILYLRIQL